jgi:hypothetical protein
MIPEYKLYHGAVLAELVDKLVGPLVVDELKEDGRLSSYILNGAIGLHIKHSTQRMHPWQFTFSKSNLVDLLTLQERYSKVFVAFVCRTDSIVCLSIEELTSILSGAESDQASVRVDRRPGKWSAVSGTGGNSLPRKKPQGVDLILEALAD